MAAENLIGNMFGVDPNQLAQQRYDAQRQAALQYAQLDPFERANMGMYQAGGNLVSAGAGMMGVKAPGEAQAEKRQSILNRIDMTNPEHLMKGAELANQEGDTQLAYFLVNNARQMKSEASKQALEAARAKELTDREPATEGIKQVGTSNGVPVYYDSKGQYTFVNGQRVPFTGKIDMSEKGDRQGSGRPMPPSALNKMTEHADFLNSSSQMEQDTKAWADKIKAGKLNLSLLDNVSGKLEVKAGIGGQEAVELANFATYIEELRGNKLLLAKGTQTATDAKQMLDQIVSSTTNPKYVLARLNALWKNAAEKSRVSKMHLNQYKRTYKDEAFDPESYTAKTSAYEMPKTSTSMYKEGQTATNPQTGKKLIFRGGQWQPM